jgi:hypothetical protein
VGKLGIMGSQPNPMKIAAFGAFAIMMAITPSARADDIQSAYAAVNALLQKDGGELVPRQAMCPQGHDNLVEW